MAFSRQKYAKILFFSFLLIVLFVVAGCAKERTFVGKVIETTTTSICQETSNCGYANTSEVSKIWTNISSLHYYIGYIFARWGELQANVSALNLKTSQTFTPVLVLASPTESEAIDLCASAGYNGCVAGIFVKQTEYFSSKDKKCTGKQLIEKETVMRPCDSVPAAPTGCVIKLGSEPEAGDQITTETLQSILCLK